MKESDAFIMKECDKLMTNACLRAKSCKGCPFVYYVGETPFCDMHIGAPELKEGDINEDDQDAGNI